MPSYTREELGRLPVEEQERITTETDEMLAKDGIVVHWNPRICDPPIPEGMSWDEYERNYIGALSEGRVLAMRNA